jgi:hypothetical protein
MRLGNPQTHAQKLSFGYAVRHTWPSATIDGRQGGSVRRETAAAIIGAAFLMLAGCAEKSADPDVATADGGGQSASAPAAAAGQAAFEACLLRNGVDITKLDGVDAATVTEASAK